MSKNLQKQKNQKSDYQKLQLMKLEDKIKFNYILV